MEVLVPEAGGAVAVAAGGELSPRDLSPLSGGLGLAVDIGTTTVAADLIDMSDGRKVASGADVNAQRLRGEDVLARIQYAEDGGTAELRSLVLGSLNGIVDGWGVPPGGIRSVCVAGNTAMTHLFLGVDPSPIRLPPYEPVVREAEVRGSESGLHVAPDARVLCMPCVASYVGGDIASGIVRSGMDLDPETSLFIDVGTNGEVAVGSSEMIAVCSSSAGPAFEGGRMACGMLARPGAIDGVRVADGEIRCTVIGGGEPKGICGSGIVDLVAQLFLAGMLDRAGNLTAASGAEGGVLRVAGDVAVTQEEIRDVISTKAAVFSASRTLLRDLGLGFGDIARVYIAGGFGGSVDLDSAVALGLLPDVDRSKYRYLGNASLAGAGDALLSAGFRERVSAAFSRMTYVDLSGDPAFSDEYMSARFLPHTDASLFPSVGY